MSTSPGTPEDKVRFDSVVIKTLVNEGGDKIYSDPATGEYSKYGISLKFLRGIHPDAKASDISSLTEDGARYLYYEYFYMQPKFWRLDDNEVLYKIFDLGVNCGPYVAIRILQRAVVSLGGALKVDGQLGPVTAAAANAISASILIPEIKLHAAARYKLIAQDPNNAKNLPGWLARLEKA